MMTLSGDEGGVLDTNTEASVKVEEAMEGPASPSESDNEAASMELYFNVIEEEMEGELKKENAAVRKIKTLRKDKMRLKFAIQKLKEENVIIRNNIAALYKAGKERTDKLQAEIVKLEEMRTEIIRREANVSENEEKNQSN